jgi:hypothetical protein
MVRSVAITMLSFDRSTVADVAAILTAMWCSRAINAFEWQAQVYERAERKETYSRGRPPLISGSSFEEAL